MDEWDGNYIIEFNRCRILKSFQKKLEKRLMQEISIVWIAPSSSCRSRNKAFPVEDNEIEEDFITVKLVTNFRNTKEVSNKAFNVAEQSLFQYANGLSKPPSIFPNGPSPVYAESFDEAIFRLMTKKGILLVSDNEKINLQTKKVYNKSILFIKGMTNSNF